MKTSLVVLVVLVTAAPEYRTIAAKPSPRIIGGHEAFPNSIPYQVFLAVDAVINQAQGPVRTAWNCSGFLITTNYILTAAACVYKWGVDIMSITIVLGAHNLSSVESTQEFRTAAQTVVYPLYPNHPTIDYDIALLRMNRSVSYTSSIRSIDLPSRADVVNKKNFFDYTARVAGWGLLNGSDSNSTSDVLYYFDAPVIKSSKCLLGYTATSPICTSGRANVTICNGDTGAPLVADFKQIGIGSLWNLFSCTTGSSSGYTRVTNHMDWIVDNSDYLWP